MDKFDEVVRAYCRVFDTLYMLRKMNTRERVRRLGSQCPNHQDPYDKDCLARTTDGMIIGITGVLNE